MSVASTSSTQLPTTGFVPVAPQFPQQYVTSIRMGQNTRFIKLNVGGREFITTTETLCKEDSLLSTMVTQHFNKSNNEGSGKKFSDLQNQEPLFIDRDGKAFADILNFLRNGTLEPLPSTEDSWQELRREAEYFQLSSLIELLKNSKRKKKYRFYVLIKGGSFSNCQVFPPAKSYEKRHSNPCNMVSCLNAHLRDDFQIEKVVWPTVSSDACQVILYKYMEE